MPGKIIIVTAAYGHDEVEKRGGQQGVLSIIADAGADGVEIRRELLLEQELADLTLLAEAIHQHALMCCYSAPEPLCMDDGSLNPNIPNLLAEADRLDAAWLKLSLGHFQHPESLHALPAWLSAARAKLVIENDQTECGKLAPMKHFAEAASQAHLPVTLTFDTANWLWTGEEPEHAARLLASSVSYIHVKAAAAHGGKVRAIALDEGGPRWKELLHALPASAYRGIEFPLQGADLTAITRHYVEQLREE